MLFSNVPLRVYSKLILTVLLLGAGLFSWLGISQPAGSGSPKSFLTLEERVRCTLAIEGVYWLHRGWPQENVSARPAFQNVYSEDSVRRKVETVLRKNYALETYWQRSVSPEALQAEIDRQARESFAPDVLQHLWSVLDRDPLRIAEVLARPSVVENLASRVEGFDSWWRVYGSRMPAEVVTRPYAYHLPAPGALNANRQLLTPAPNAPSARFGHSVVYTGPTTTSEMVVWGGQGIDTSGNPVFLNTGGRYSAATNTWTATSTVNAPSARAFHTATWTGKAMVVWGSGGATNTRTGGVYDPVTDTWKTITLTAAPTARSHHTATWTGTEVIIWGGDAQSGSKTTVLRSGARYNPTSDRWTVMPLANAPSARRYHTQNWNGFAMFLWGGESLSSTGARTFLNTGAYYNAPQNKWIAMSKLNAPAPRSGHTASWTGNRIIYWGGQGAGAGNAAIALNTGGVFNVYDNTWAPTPTAGAPTARFGHSSQFVGGADVAIWGGQTPSGTFLKNGAILNWVQGRWRPIAAGGAPAARAGHSACSNGAEMILWGGRGPGNLLFSSGARYHPIARRWTQF